LANHGLGDKLMQSMYWVMGGTILFGMGMLLRQVLGLRATVPSRMPVSLDPEQKSFRDAVTRQVTRRSEILASVLNDVIAESKAGHSENASDLLDLFDAEWTRQAELLSVILRNVADHLPLARIVIPVRSMVPGHFISDVMIDYLRLPELVDQFLFRTKLRFHLQIRTLRHAVDILTTDFRRADSQRHLNPAYSDALWIRLDRDYHDFDLISKRTILALGKFMSWLPQGAATGFVRELRPMLEGVRSLAGEKVRTAVCR
jgi:hypothetical protein